MKPHKWLLLKRPWEFVKELFRTYLAKAPDTLIKTVKENTTLGDIVEKRRAEHRGEKVKKVERSIDALVGELGQKLADANSPAVSVQIPPTELGERLYGKNSQDPLLSHLWLDRIRAIESFCQGYLAKHAHVQIVARS